MVQKISSIATVTILTVAFLFLAFYSQAQNQVVLNRLCKSWRLTKIINQSTNTSEEAPQNFKMIIRSDHTLSQGMFPDGVIHSTWQLNEQTMVFTITDVKTKFISQLKVMRITSDELQLQESSSDMPVILYYRPDSEE